MLLRLIAPIVGNAIGLYVAANYVPGVEFFGSRWELLLAGALIGLLNAFIKPIVRLLALPVIILSAGIASFFINIGILWLADFFLTDLEITGILPLVTTSLILSFVHIFL